MSSEIKGIIADDIILRTAIVTGLQYLRDDPSQLNDVFGGLTQDDLTKNEYGQAEVNSAKKWFLSTDIPVSLNFRIDSAVLPIISIGLQEISEAEQTIADLHYVVQEDVDAPWPALAGPFDPVQYAPSSGLMLLPADKLGTILPEVGMSIIDKEGRPYVITQVDDYTIGIQAGITTDFKGAFLKGANPRQISQVESVNSRVTYIIGVHVQGESTFLSYLHSIVMYVLRKYNQNLLEARGIDRATFSSTEFRRNNDLGPELMFSRAIMMTAYTRASWRKSTAGRIQSVDTSGMIIERTDFTGTVEADVIEQALNGYFVEP